MHRSLSLCVSVLLAVSCVPFLHAQQGAGLTGQFNSLIDSAYKPDEPGGVVLVSRNGNAIYERAFGMARCRAGRAHARQLGVFHRLHHEAVHRGRRTSASGKRHPLP